MPELRLVRRIARPILGYLPSQRRVYGDRQCRSLRIVYYLSGSGRSGYRHDMSDDLATSRSPTPRTDSLERNRFPNIQILPIPISHKTKQFPSFWTNTPSSQKPNIFSMIRNKYQPRRTSDHPFSTRFPFCHIIESGPFQFL